MTPATELRSELEPLPARMRDLPVDRGYPVPWFVEWIDGPFESKVPEFRATSGRKIALAHRNSLCWTCGTKLGAHKCFVIGPMCGINRISSEPPSHLECVQWSARNCPFLSRPHMVRREDELTESMKGNGSGIMIPRNPGVTLLWVTRAYIIVNDGKGGGLFQVGDPEEVFWYSQGKPATRGQVLESVETGLPLLLGMLAMEKEEDRTDAQKEIERRTVELEKLYPEV
jgi:hypothetical protein